MKKILIFTLIFLLVLCFAACSREHLFREHTWEYICYEEGHYKQYTCGCPSPDVLGLHCDNDGDGACDDCGYKESQDPIEWLYSDTHHWYLPEGDVMVGVVYGYEEHKNYDADLFCDICGYDMSKVPPTNHFLRNQAGCEWLNEISAEDIAEIKTISGGGGPLPPISFTHIFSSTDKAVISSIFEDYYWLDSTPVSEERTQIADGGYFRVQFVLNDASVKELYFINGEFYHDGNGNYFELTNLPVFRYGTDFVNYYGFEIWDKECSVYLMDGLLAAAVPTEELEFVELMDDIYLDAATPTHYIEMNGVRINFLFGEYFYISDDRTTYYQLVGKKLDELIAEYAILYD